MSAVYTPKHHKEMMRGFVPAISEVPSVIGIWPSGICNFKCKYCIQSADIKTKQAECFPEQIMNWDIFMTLAEQLRDFFPRMDTAVFCGVGEPLLNTRLSDMIRYLKSNQIVNRIEVVTNGSLLEQHLSLELIKAGTDLIMISVQGLDSCTYREICGYDISIDWLIEQIRFLYEHRDNCFIHLKALNIGVPLYQKDAFIKMFGDYCNSIHIDYVAPLFKNINYSEIIGEVRDQYNGQPIDMTKTKPCTLPFQSIFVLPNGDVAPCCLTPNPVYYGNINKQPLANICQSQERVNFLRLHIEGRQSQNSVCNQCVQPFIIL